MNKYLASHVNVPLVKATIAELSEYIKKHKRNYKRTWPRFTKYNWEKRVSEWPYEDELMFIDGRKFHPSVSLRQRLFAAKEITILHALLASTRNKVHLQGMSLEEQEAWLENNHRYIKQYSY